MNVMNALFIGAISSIANIFSRRVISGAQKNWAIQCFIECGFGFFLFKNNLRSLKNIQNKQ